MAFLRLSALVCTFAFAALPACSSGTTLTQGDGGAHTVTVTPEDDGGATDAAGGTSCFEQQPASQALSQPCCVARGIDACGADLFCAALDGRTQATCYPNRSRGDGETCTADIQCAGDHCNADHICRVDTTTNPDGGGPIGKCVMKCATNVDCQNSCPAVAHAIACCDGATGVCYESASAACPGP